MLDQGTVSWGSKKQTSVSLSTIETEFVAVSTAVREILWHRSLFHSLDMTLTDLTYLHINNHRTLELIKSGQINNCTKHIETKFRYICDCEEAGDISGVHMAIEDQMADIMTKSLEPEKFVLFQEMIEVHS